MARGNQRDKAREKAQKAAAGVKHKTTVSGAQQARDKDDAAAIMRAKQAAADAKKKEGEAAKK
ncbi:hypothetical protein K431DRAFT_305087 [Polychaeton citri CBS 116435]|uniref:Small EDRK-rich factor-like N-terminal domain-containing protein n=1 Tax=Polychaeton citri CBS 116435 TaxID=1314669 RepID=A0A9P4UKW3_9PEZI|nr:hypothetical protein K431DRAFT_305087 [Polychaeton citri CBS 116435]